METIDNLIKNLVLRFSYLGVKQIAQSGTTLIGPAPFIASEVDKRDGSFYLELYIGGNLKYCK